MSFPVQFIFILGMVVLGCAKVTLQGSMSRRFIRSAPGSVLYNAELFFTIALLFLLIFPKGELFTFGIICGIICGAATVGFQSCYTLALGEGPVSITVLLTNLSALVTTIFSFFCYHENLYITQLIAIALLGISVVLSTKTGPSEKGISRKWIILMIATFLCNCVSSIGMKVFGMSEEAKAAPNSDITFMILLYAVAAVMAFLLYTLTTVPLGKKTFTGGFSWQVALFSLAIGVVLTVYQKMYMYGVANIDGSFMYPTYAGLQTLGMTVIGVILFRDKLSKRQFAGVLFGVAGIVLINLRVGYCFVVG